MTSASWALQQAIFAKLTASEAVSSAVGTRVFDMPPRDTAFPYITIGDGGETNWDTATEPGSQHSLAVHVWSRAGGHQEAKRHAATASAVTIELWQAMSEAVAPGDGFTVSAGCDKQFATCKAKFANQANFRGFPYMPGNDVVLSYPASSTPLDGGSRYGN